jgi:peptide deformylase
MVKELIVYPDDRIYIACTDIRSFDDTLYELLQDMRDTAKEHNLKSISAIQIAHPYNVILIKNGDDYDEYINPRILKHEGTFMATETSSYYPNITMQVERYENIKIIYEDRDAKTHHKEITDHEYLWLFQQAFDHLFGGTFLDRVSKEKQDKAKESLSKDGYIEISDEVCPTFSKKDYFVSFTDKLLIFMFITIVASFFNLEKSTFQTLYSIDKFLLPVIIILMIGFFFYAQYEAKKYSQCSSCQIGNNIGVIIKRVTAAIVFSIAIFFLYGRILT